MQSTDAKNRDNGTDGKTNAPNTIESNFPGLHEDSSPTNGPILLFLRYQQTGRALGAWRARTRWSLVMAPAGRSNTLCPTYDRM